MLSRGVSSTIFKVFGMMRSGIEPRSPGPLENTLPTRPMSLFIMHPVFLSLSLSLALSLSLSLSLSLYLSKSADYQCIKICTLSIYLSMHTHTHTHTYTHTHSYRHGKLNRCVCGDMVRSVRVDQGRMMCMLGKPSTRVENWRPTLPWFQGWWCVPSGFHLLWRV